MLDPGSGPSQWVQELLCLIGWGCWGLRTLTSSTPSSWCFTQVGSLVLGSQIPNQSLFWG